MSSQFGGLKNHVDDLHERNISCQHTTLSNNVDVRTRGSMTTTKQPRCNREKTNIMPLSSRTTYIPICTAVVAVILSRLVGRREMRILSFRRNPFSLRHPPLAMSFYSPLATPRSPTPRSPCHSTPRSPPPARQPPARQRPTYRGNSRSTKNHCYCTARTSAAAPLDPIRRPLADER